MFAGVRIKPILEKMVEYGAMSCGFIGMPVAFPLVVLGEQLLGLAAGAVALFTGGVLGFWLGLAEERSRISREDGHAVVLPEPEGR
jgi:hypothetical protein